MAAGSARCFWHGRLPDSSPLESGAEARLRPGIQMEDTGGIRIVLAGVPAARPLHRGQRSISVSGLTDPVRHAPAGGGTSAMAIQKTLSAACE